MPIPPFSSMLRTLQARCDVRIGIGYLFALALVPGVLAGSVLFYDFYRSQRAQLEQEASQTARALSQAVDSELAGTLASRNLEGTPSFVAFSRSASSGWTMAVSMTREVLFASLYRPLALAALSIVAFIFAGAMLSWIFARQVRAALRALGAATDAAAAGDTGALAPLSGPSDIARLARRFNHMQEARRDSEARLRLAASVFGAASEAIIIVDGAARIVDVNQSFSELTGYSRDEAIGQNPRMLQSGKHDPAFYAAMWQALNQDGRWQGQIWDRRKDASLFAARMTISVVRDDAGAVSRYIVLFSDITDSLRQQKEIDLLAYYDPLTRLPNRRLLYEQILRALPLAARRHGVVAVCYLDLDGFKPVNDTFGHQTGAQVLVEVGRRLQAAVCAHDAVARLGGDEFVLLLTELESPAEASLILERVLALLGQPFAVDEDDCPNISASIGVAFYPEDGGTPDELLRHSDQAMYQAKRAGRNQVRRFSPERDSGPD